MEIEVFRTGTHTDSSGRKRTWTEQDLERIATQYNEQPDTERHEAPVVLGHPTDNAPAYGWVESLRCESGKLLATIGQLASDFVEWVKEGRYKKRSISLYSDGTLRHVGFLGAMPPAVKGLADPQFVEFSRPAAETYDYGDPRVSQISTMLSRIREFIIEKFSTEEADRVLPSDGFEDLSYEPYDNSSWITERLAHLEGVIEGLRSNPQPSLYTEPTKMNNDNKKPDSEQKEGGDSSDFAEKLVAKDAEIARLNERIQGLEKNQLPADFAEKEEAREKRMAALEAEAQEMRFNEFLNRDDIKKRVAPANRASVLRRMKSLAKIDGEVEYSEGEETKQGSELDAYKSEIASGPVLVEYGEMATNETAGSARSAKGTGFDLPTNSAFDEGRLDVHKKALEIAQAEKIEYTEALDRAMEVLNYNG